MKEHKTFFEKPTSVKTSKLVVKVTSVSRLELVTPNI